MDRCDRHEWHSVSTIGGWLHGPQEPKIPVREWAERPDLWEGAALSYAELTARIGEASRYFPREQLALSTQCGFASAGPGNAISEGAQENKLRLVGEVADRVWRTGG